MCRPLCTAAVVATVRRGSGFTFVYLFVCLLSSYFTRIHKGARARGGSLGIIVSRACPSPPPLSRVCDAVSLLHSATTSLHIKRENDLFVDAQNTHTHTQKFTTHDRLIHFLLPNPVLATAWAKTGDGNTSSAHFLANRGHPLPPPPPLGLNNINTTPPRSLWPLVFCVVSGSVSTLPRCERLLHSNGKR